MGDRRPQDKQHGDTNPGSRGIWNILSVTCCRYGHRKIHSDKDWKKQPSGKALFERIL